jgi:hypothetical protein
MTEKTSSKAAEDEALKAFIVVLAASRALENARLLAGH